MATKAKMRKGGSNVGRYKGLKSSQFAGPSGGAPAGSFPVNSPGRARAAIGRSINAPNPEGIKRKARAAMKRFKRQGKA